MCISEIIFCILHINKRLYRILHINEYCAANGNSQPHENKLIGKFCLQITEWFFIIYLSKHAGCIFAKKRSYIKLESKQLIENFV